ncbi:hypothetical protein DLAC_04551 [Tieghemostelium lacteum]|uniref:Uncharacterized protein n=1 Tax=Tieghemostelium lacteum TaxID=361077 RepID=A0A151ZKB1_TIELA|nr:hypothetical protein DLAC_04551 [Tieghemostelium lacteum]|eukprot:KYQ94254.1 hypothetical protein DLAC_04551 [Tieghemostelium lacteum]
MKKSEVPSTTTKTVSPSLSGSSLPKKTSSISTSSGSLLTKSTSTPLPGTKQSLSKSSSTTDVIKQVKTTTSPTSSSITTPLPKRATAPSTTPSSSSSTTTKPLLSKTLSTPAMSTTKRPISTSGSGIATGTTSSTKTVTKVPATTSTVPKTTVTKSTSSSTKTSSPSLVSMRPSSKKPPLTSRSSPTLQSSTSKPITSSKTASVSKSTIPSTSSSSSSARTSGSMALKSTTKAPVVQPVQPKVTFEQFDPTTSTDFENLASEYLDDNDEEVEEILLYDENDVEEIILDQDEIQIEDLDQEEEEVEEEEEVVLDEHDDEYSNGVILYPEIIDLDNDDINNDKVTTSELKQTQTLYINNNSEISSTTTTTTTATISYDQYLENNGNSNLLEQQIEKPIEQEEMEEHEEIEEFKKPIEPSKPIQIKKTSSWMSSLFGAVVTATKSTTTIISSSLSSSSSNSTPPVTPSVTSTSLSNPVPNHLINDSANNIPPNNNINSLNNTQPVPPSNTSPQLTPDSDQNLSKSTPPLTFQGPPPLAPSHQPLVNNNQLKTLPPPNLMYQMTHHNNNHHHPHHPQQPNGYHNNFNNHHHHLPHHNNQHNNRHSQNFNNHRHSQQIMNNYRIQPHNQPGGQALIPFAITSFRALSLFQDWYKSLWFAPTDFKEKIEPTLEIYKYFVPYYVFSTIVHSVHSGKVGFLKNEDPNQQAVIVSQDEHKKKQHETEEIEWMNGSTHPYTQSHNDILIYSPVLNHNALDPPLYEHIKEINEWRLEVAEPFHSQHPQLLYPNYVVEQQQFLLQNGYQQPNTQVTSNTPDSTNPMFNQLPIVTSKMDWEKSWHFAETKIKKNEIYGNDQKLKSDYQATMVKDVETDTKFENISYRTVYAPMYKINYQYDQKDYQFIINGQSGRTYTKVRPYGVGSIKTKAIKILTGGVFSSEKTKSLEQDRKIVNGMVRGKDLNEIDELFNEETGERIQLYSDDCYYLLLPNSDQFLILKTTGYLILKNIGTTPILIQSHKRMSDEIGGQCTLDPNESQTFAYKGSWCIAVLEGDFNSLELLKVETNSGSDKPIGDLQMA